ncbi:Protein DEHYDRATION-INDUCED 19-like [Heracleum sosnowskyi]|uniref:Protein DEHYDRATION-INDUCED 19-like n=1 Tax=Heracleum sosnowskyi TaxID=360622 RepID=A0AAD8HW36_9APIA|nr:Protein DEHYDRATION-INDUCED 19-like [Heracleum sosnowskyi]
MEDDDMRAWFPCPFCYVGIQVSAVCLHLQEEHCFDLKNTVCPICAANLGKDAIGHFTTQHSHVLKRRRKSQKSGSRSNNSMVPGKTMRELHSYCGPQSTNGISDMHVNAPDPLLSPFLRSTLPNPESNADALISCNHASTTLKCTRTKSAMLDGAQEQDYRENIQRAAFVQQLILSTIF